MKINDQKVYSFHIRKAVDYIQKNYEDPLSLDDIAEYLGLNRCYFCKMFKKETGMTYSRFINEIRIEKSKKMLLHTNLSILEIALSLGYNNQSYFNIAFKKLTGITPLKYRKVVNVSYLKR